MVILIIGKLFIIYLNLFAKNRSLIIDCLTNLLNSRFFCFSYGLYQDIYPSPGLKTCVSILRYILITQACRCRYGQYIKLREQIDKNEGGLEAFSRGYEIFGFTRR